MKKIIKTEKQKLKNVSRRKFLGKSVFYTAATVGLIYPKIGNTDLQKDAEIKNFKQNKNEFSEKDFLKLLFIKKKEHKVLNIDTKGMVIEKNSKRFRLNGNGSFLWEHLIQKHNVLNLCMVNKQYIEKHFQSKNDATLSFLKLLNENKLITVTFDKFDKNKVDKKKSIISYISPSACQMFEENMKNIKTNQKISVIKTKYEFRGMIPQITQLND